MSKKKPTAKTVLISPKQKKINKELEKKFNATKVKLNKIIEEQRYIAEKEKPNVMAFKTKKQIDRIYADRTKKAKLKLQETKKIKEQFGNAKTPSDKQAAIKEFESKNPSKMKRVKEAVKAKFSGLFKNTEVKKKAGNLSPKSGVGQQKKTQQRGK